MRVTASGICAVLLFACAGYCAWAWHRSELWDIAHDPAWPHPFPYPDRWVHDLERYLDRRRPAPPGTVKMHGEFQHVRHAAGLAAVALAGAGILASVPTLLHFFRCGTWNRTGFPVAAGGSESRGARGLDGVRRESDGEQAERMRSGA